MNLFIISFPFKIFESILKYFPFFPPDASLFIVCSRSAFNLFVRSVTYLLIPQTFSLRIKCVLVSLDATKTSRTSQKMLNNGLFFKHRSESLELRANAEEMLQTWHYNERRQIFISKLQIQGPAPKKSYNRRPACARRF